MVALISFGLGSYSSERMGSFVGSFGLGSYPVALIMVFSLATIRIISKPMSNTSRCYVGNKHIKAV